MELILFDKDRGQLGHFRVTPKRLWLGALSLSLSLFAGAFYVGWHAADAYGITNPTAEVEAWRAELRAQQSMLEQTRRGLQQSVDALALRLGQMNAHIVRLDALGSRLTQMAGLDDGEFDFTSAPALGGPEDLLGPGDQLDLRGILGSLDVLSFQLDDRSRQLDILEDMLLDRKLADEVRPGGRPVASGYISSRFGQRTDPFTGRRAFHQGIDFAGRAGSEVIAVASGVVVWSGERHGYGELVEINHGNGYVTRYAHNSSNLVSVGDTVKRGQIIAKLGDTGRATGPNLHFEVLRHGRAVDPMSYVN
jgi:murein DD-endopeptidase MepM/ murein hydrolase activator NlpD